jgi:cob(I)alamin adenosyltransferase
MSIAIKRGDKGQTSLIGGPRVSKSDQRVEAYGTVDELGAQIGFARAICEDEEVREIIKAIQTELFHVSSVIVTVLNEKRAPPEVTVGMIDTPTAQVNRIEQIDGITKDWSLPGEHTAAALDVARTTCRRAERSLVRLMESDNRVQLQSVEAYISRLSDLLWLLGRLLEIRACINSRLRDGKSPELNIASCKTDLWLTTLIHIRAGLSV